MINNSHQACETAHTQPTKTLTKVQLVPAQQTIAQPTRKLTRETRLPCWMKEFVSLILKNDTPHTLSIAIL